MLIASLIVLQIIIFAILIVILRRILAQNIISATAHLEELSREYARKEREINLKLQETNKKSQEIIAKAQQEAIKIKTDILKTSESERDRILKQAHSMSEEIIQKAEKTRQLLLDEINKRISKEAIDKACELIQLTLPDEFKFQVHKEWVKELIESGFEQIKDLQLQSDAKSVKVYSAFTLDDTQKERLQNKLAKILKKDFELQEILDKKIVAGLIIHIGSLVLDGSLRNKIEENARVAKYAG